MPLSILVPMILIGLPVVIGLVWWVNKDNENVGLKQELARNRFLLDFPNAELGAIVICDNGKTALLELMNKAGLGMVHGLGQNFLTRELTKASIISLEEDAENLVIRLRDFTLKKLTIKDSTGKARKLIEEMLAKESY